VFRVQLRFDVLEIFEFVINFAGSWGSSPRTGNDECGIRLHGGF
jgi:hypothetical protein